MTTNYKELSVYSMRAAEKTSAAIDSFVKEMLKKKLPAAHWVIEHKFLWVLIPFFGLSLEDSECMGGRMIFLYARKKRLGSLLIRMKVTAE